METAGWLHHVVGAKVNLPMSVLPVALLFARLTPRPTIQLGKFVNKFIQLGGQ